MEPPAKTTVNGNNTPEPVVSQRRGQPDHYPSDITPALLKCTSARDKGAALQRLNCKYMIEYDRVRWHVFR
jgi:hypothetical protein